jgi:hypothetical protein
VGVTLGMTDAIPGGGGGWAGDRLQVGDPAAEELTGGPAILTVEPAQPALARDGQPLEAAVAGELATEPVPAEGAPVVGVTPAVKDHRAIGPADQRTPKPGSRAVGSQMASAPARPAALRDTSGPSAWATVSRPRSFQFWPPSPSR